MWRLFTSVGTCPSVFGDPLSGLVLSSTADLQRYTYYIESGWQQLPSRIGRWPAHQIVRRIGWQRLHWISRQLPYRIGW